MFYTKVAFTSDSISMCLDFDILNVIVELCSLNTSSLNQVLKSYLTQLNEENRLIFKMSLKLQEQNVLSSATQGEKMDLFQEQPFFEEKPLARAMLTTTRT